MRIAEKKAEAVLQKLIAIEVILELKFDGKIVGAEFRGGFADLEGRFGQRPFFIINHGDGQTRTGELELAGQALPSQSATGNQHIINRVVRHCGGSVPICPRIVNFGLIIGCAGAKMAV